MLENGSFSNCCEAGELARRPGWPGEGSARPSGTARPPWVAPTLSAVLIITTAGDVVGNLLVILSVLRNRKLRNAGERHARFWGRPFPEVRSPPSPLHRSPAPRSLFSNLDPKLSPVFKRWGCCCLSPTCGSGTHLSPLPGAHWAHLCRVN